MRLFTHVNARTIDEAVTVLRRYGKKASIIAGGTDLLGKMKDEILPTLSRGGGEYQEHPWPRIDRIPG